MLFERERNAAHALADMNKQIREELERPLDFGGIPSRLKSEHSRRMEAAHRAIHGKTLADAISDYKKIANFKTVRSSDLAKLASGPEITKLAIELSQAGGILESLEREFSAAKRIRGRIVYRSLHVGIAIRQKLFDPLKPEWEAEIKERIDKLKNAPNDYNSRLKWDKIKSELPIYDLADYRAIRTYLNQKRAEWEANINKQIEEQSESRKIESENKEAKLLLQKYGRLEDIK